MRDEIQAWDKDVLGPVDDLLVSVVVSVASWEGIRVHETTQWVATLLKVWSASLACDVTTTTYQVSTVRVQFTSIVVRGQVDLCLVDEPGNLDVVGGLDQLDTLEGTVWNEAGAVAGLCAPCHFLCLGVANGRVWLGRCPETEIWSKSVDAIGAGTDEPSMWLTNEVWHMEFWFSVVELQMLYPT